MTTLYKESKSEENFNEKNMTVQLLFCLKIDISKKV